MSYKTYWSIYDLPANYLRSETVFLCIAVISALLWLAVNKRMRRNGDYEKTILLWSVGIIFSFAAGVSFYIKFFTKDHTPERLAGILATSELVEGCITSFNRRVEHKMYTDVTLESFEVDSIKFSYADYLLGRFNRFSKTNTILINGLRVRITYIKTNHEIQKIEIATAANHSPH